MVGSFLIIGIVLVNVNYCQGELPMSAQLLRFVSSSDAVDPMSVPIETSQFR